jgi:sterol desaturase/sphingolipid hydroxylase (fatty acid hydroxylase superfamily)
MSQKDLAAAGIDLIIVNIFLAAPGQEATLVHQRTIYCSLYLKFHKEEGTNLLKTQCTMMSVCWSGYCKFILGLIGNSAYIAAWLPPQPHQPILVPCLPHTDTFITATPTIFVPLPEIN